MWLCYTILYAKSERCAEAPIPTRINFEAKVFGGRSASTIGIRLRTKKEQRLLAVSNSRLSAKCLMTLDVSFVNSQHYCKGTIFAVQQEAHLR